MNDLRIVFVAVSWAWDVVALLKWLLSVMGV